MEALKQMSTTGLALQVKDYDQLLRILAQYIGGNHASSQSIGTGATLQVGVNFSQEIGFLVCAFGWADLEILASIFN